MINHLKTHSTIYDEYLKKKRKNLRNTNKMKTNKLIHKIKFNKINKLHNFLSQQITSNLVKSNYNFLFV
jgi:tRNA U34 5-carboxymethylaminomethyl modifying enzyme MnmG/GidA